MNAYAADTISDLVDIIEIIIVMLKWQWSLTRTLATPY